MSLKRDAARRLILVFLFLCFPGFTRSALSSPPQIEKPASTPDRLRRGETRRICRITNTSVNPASETGLRGSDLGVSFPDEDRLCFLFGDSWMVDPADPGNHKHDSMAFGSIARPPGGNALKLTWPLSRPGRFKELAAKGLSLGIMEVPVEGIRLSGRTYIFFDSGWDASRQRHRFSALTHADDPAVSELKLDYCVPSERFINLSAEPWDSGEDGDPWIYLFGTGAFRKSPVYLARVKASRISDRSAYRYYCGQGEDGPRYIATEEDAESLFEAEDVGELSVARHTGLECWLMTYNSRKPPGIHLRWADAPHGPWSKPLLIFKPWKDDGYTSFIHAKRSYMGYDDGLSDPGREEEWGGFYGPYMIPSYFYSQGRGHHVISYTLSSWNPYQVHWMETDLFTTEYTGSTGPKNDSPLSGSSGLENLDFSQGSLKGWISEGNAFKRIKDEKGRYLVTSYDERSGGGKATGTLWRAFEVDPTMKVLQFDLYGGHGSVKLFDGRDLVRRTSGPMSLDEPVRARWNLQPLSRRTVRLVIEDRHQDRWGYVKVSGFRIESR